MSTVLSRTRDQEGEYSIQSSTYDGGLYVMHMTCMEVGEAPLYAKKLNDGI